MEVKRRLIFGILLVLFFPGAVLAQKKGEVKVVKDSLIAILQQYRSALARDIAYGSSQTASEDPSQLTRTTVRGYRVQIFLGRSRSEAYAEQARFRQLFDDIETYITYDAPNYRVKVGDFRSRREAERLMEGLREQFSNVFVFTEDIVVYQ